MRLNKKTIGLGIVVLLILLQLVPIDRSIPEIGPEADFLVAENVPTEMATLLQSACYDCHSYQTTYPWYAKVAPLSMWIQGHVKAGREELNFSTWTSYDFDKATHKLEESAEEVLEKHMPLKSYTWLHAEAKLTDTQRDALSQWLKQMYRGLSYE